MINVKGVFDMKKVLFIIESLGDGGAEKILTTLIKNVDKTKYDITVFVIAKTGIYVKEVESVSAVKQKEILEM